MAATAATRASSTLTLAPNASTSSTTARGSPVSATAAVTSRPAYARASVAPRHETVAPVAASDHSRPRETASAYTRTEARGGATGTATVTVPLATGAKKVPS